MMVHMRKLILMHFVAFLVLMPLILTLVSGCKRSNDVLAHLERGSEIAVTKQDGQVVTGRLAETRSDALVVQPASGPAATVATKDIAKVTIARVPAQATGGAAPGPSATGTSTPAAVTPGQAAPVDQSVDQSVASAGGPRAAAVPEAREVVLPVGTKLDIRLDDGVASDTSHMEEAVHATLVEGLVVHGVTALPAGSAVSGTVTNAKRSGKVKGVAQLGIRFDTVKPKGSVSPYRMRTGIVTRRAATTHKKDALSIVGPAAGGAILGGIFGGKKGALIGTTVGGGAGTAVVLSTRGKEVRLPKGTRLVIRLMDPLTVHVPA